MWGRYIRSDASPPKIKAKMVGGFMTHMLRKLKDQKGATAVEYGMMVALIAGVIIITVTLLGTTVNAGFTAFVAAL